MTQQADTHAQPAQGPVIVGVGASAGGLEALQQLLDGVPDHHEFVFILVQHLDPHHDSMLSDLLSKHTRSPVLTAQDDQTVVPGSIYLIPPNKALTLQNGKLRLAPFDSPRGQRRPIDILMTSIAEQAGDSAVGIVLSGTGSDGSRGAQAIKEHGGLVLAQDPGQAKYDGMPRAVMKTGAVDLVLPTGEMMSMLDDYFQRRSGLHPEILSDAEFIDRVAQHVRYRTGHDFRHYKRATLLRRLAVRMSVLGITAPDAYLRELVSNKDEAARLFRDLLINVTSFFRDDDAFDKLRSKVLPRIIEGRGRDDELRIWVPGCSTGQEAYTIAMLVAREVERDDVHPRVSIFATDIDDDALAVARRGIYPNSIIDEVPGEFLTEFFISTPEGYEVSAKLRDMVKFSSQSLIKDPPFSRLDLVSCRNVTIYFDSYLQDLAIHVFHYALREDGFLFLGPSESPRIIDDCFSEIDARQRLFRRRKGPAVPLRLVQSATPRKVAPGAPLEDDSTDSLTRLPYAETLLRRYTPAFLHLSAEQELLYASETAAPYLQIRPGAPDMSVRALIKPELEPALRRLLNGMGLKSDTTEIEYQGELDGRQVRIVISCEDLKGGGLLVVLRDQMDLRPDRMQSRDPSGAGSGSVDSIYVDALEKELDEARQTIRSNIEELETSNEELKSSNEEMMSMNEELQSANEELSTTNEELQNKIHEVNEANADLANLIRAIRVPTVFLDQNLRLRSFTPEALSIFSFADHDRGRPLEEISSRIDGDRLLSLCKEVARSGEAQTARFIDGEDDRVFSAQVVPYHTERETSSGVVFTLTDVSAEDALARQAEQNRLLAESRLAEVEEVYNVSPLAMGLIDPDMRVIRANRRFAALTGAQPQDLTGQSIAGLVPGADEVIHESVRSVLSTGAPVLGMRFEAGRETTGTDDDPRIWEVDWYPVRFGGETTGIGINVHDITDDERLKYEQRRLMRELQHRVKNILANVVALVNRAARDARHDTDAMKTLTKRIQALSKTHSLLSNTVGGATRIRQIIEPELTAVYGPDRVRVRGRNIQLSPRTSLALATAFHELATNAAKFGAFSTPDGQVSLAWKRVDDGEADEFVFTWRETGGPVTALPTRTGFGSQLIRSTVETTLDGSIEFSWEPEGLLCVIRVPSVQLLKQEDRFFDDIFAS
ncbi:MAG: chemotaxis protein CheB [Celeribacter sp.]|jgi:two-component system CheB/CheR fusion protein